MSESRYDGFPQVFLSGDKAKALAHLGRAKSLLSEVQKLREVVGGTAYSKTIYENGAEITARCIGEINTIHVHAALVYAKEEERPIYHFPVLLSGYVEAVRLNSLVPDEEFLARAEQLAEAEERELTPEERELASFPMGNFAPTRATVDVYGERYLEQQTTEPFKSNALCADVTEQFGPYSLEEQRDDGAILKYRAYRTLRSTLYTGAIAKCHQAVLGLHRSSINTLTATPTFMESFEALQEYMLLNPTLKHGRQTYIEKLTEARGFIPEYTHTWDDSCGLVLGYKYWWLVSIRKERILARRLPIFIGSDKKPFRDYYDNLGLSSISKFIEYFKGLPTGEGFPEGEELEGYIKAGLILDITPDDMPFAVGGWEAWYDLCGWSFSDTGTEAHNTAKRYIDAEYGKDLYESRWATIHFEVNTNNEVEFITARAQINRTDRLYRPPYYMNYMLRQDIPYKVPSDLDGGVASIVLGTRDGERPGTDRDEAFNAVVWAGYSGGTLHAISYAYNGKKSAREKDYGEAPPDCPYGNQWDWGVLSGVDILPPIMFSNVWDTRAPLDGSERRYTLISRKRGEYMTGGNFIPDVEWTYYNPYAVYHQTSISYYYDADSLKAYITNYGDRSIYSTAGEHVTRNTHTRTETHSLEYVRGPWIAYGFRCFVGVNMAARPSCAPSTGAALEETCGQVCDFGYFGNHSDSAERLICSAPSGAPCGDYVRMTPPSRCTDMGRYNKVDPPVYGIPDGSSNRVGDIEASYSAVLVSPLSSQGTKYVVDAGDFVIGAQIGNASPNYHTNEPGRVVSARNVNGYDYICASKNLVGTRGYETMGRLHSVAITEPKPMIAFVGVLDD